MAITAEQAAAIATAIENLNKSVQVNEEVLQIVKSMQSTGAAGNVAEHSSSLDAHPVLNKLRVLKGLEVGDLQNNAERFTGVETILSYTASSKQGVTKENFYGCWGTARGSTVALAAYSRNPEFTNANYRGKSIFGINAYGSSTEGNHLFSTLNLRVDSDGNGQAYIGIVDTPEGGSAIQYIYNAASITASKTADIGSTALQWKDVYLQNSPIVSSDRRLKQEFSEVPDAVFKAWATVKFCQYRFKEAVEKKGSEARLHVGLIAQEILEAFKAQGLDATAYGIVCHDSWEDQYQDVEVGMKPAVLNEKGEVVTPEEPIMEHQLIKKAGDLWTVRYEEALALEAAYQRWKLQKIEAALAEKGISL